MSGPVAEHDGLHDAVRWYERLAAVLADAGIRIGRLIEQVADDWPDERGREWTQRCAQLRGDLAREEDAAAELAAACARELRNQGNAERSSGIRLGGTEAQRVDDERGMRIAQLSDEPPS
jgi:hypothetical protein